MGTRERSAAEGFFGLQSRGRRWFKASASNGSCACVEVCFDGDLVHIRDSKSVRRDPSAASAVVTVTATVWTAILDRITGPLPFIVDSVEAVDTPDSGFALRSLGADSVTLTYTAAERRAFLDGVIAGEFDRQLEIIR